MRFDEHIQEWHFKSVLCFAVLLLNLMSAIWVHMACTTTKLVPAAFLLLMMMSEFDHLQINLLRHYADSFSPLRESALVHMLYITSYIHP